ncbi:MAG: hypothetical protein IPG57_04425 [Burkholderiales bacterium]|jgi:hypothetical protein|nr:hypothetical protein [Burkholderiales bacterium]MBP7521527.1 hypothetical protein [Leptothrix sp. (in: b-proteobacteria)]HQY09249.1 hypothetical protein [Burkholderiaceae bacterium]
MSPPSWMNRPLARLLPWLRRAAPWLCALSLLGGCGGAMENSDSEGDIARGLWSGASTDGRAVLLWVFGDGQWAGVYSSASNPTALAGGWTGRGSTSLSTFTSSSAREYSLEAAAARSASLTAAVKKSSTLAGTVGASGNLLTVATTYQSAFDSTAALASLVGTHLGTVSLIGGSLAANLQVASTGGVSGTLGSCTVSGSITARSDANAYGWQLTPSGSCTGAGQSYSGTAVDVSDGSTRLLLGLGANAGSSNALLLRLLKTS